MYSYKKFNPGVGGTSRRLIQQSTQLSADISCICTPQIEKKPSASPYAINNTSNNIRCADILQTVPRGTITFGSTFISQNQNINYLGRIEGQVGGSRTPPR